MPATDALWRRTPPATFPPVLGLFALGLAWRRAGAVFDVGAAPGEVLLAAVSLMYGFCLFAYAAKLIRRPMLLPQELRILPGQSGVAALVLCAALLAAALVPYAPAVARILVAVALFAHLGVALLFLNGLRAAPPAARRVTPVWHLSFVGFILGALAAVPLGMEPLAHLLLLATVPLACTVWVVSAVQFARHGLPAALRPLLAIHLAPAALFSLVAGDLGNAPLALLFGMLAVLYLCVLLALLPWLTEAGFGPLWAAFTFPMAASAAALLGLASQGWGWRVAGGAVLAAATLAIPVIAFRVFRDWARGTLAQKTLAVAA